MSYPSNNCRLVFCFQHLGKVKKCLLSIYLTKFPRFERSASSNASWRNDVEKTRVNDPKRAIKIFYNYSVQVNIIMRNGIYLNSLIIRAIA